ncbi:MAG: ArsR/SmtB family transcription factor [Parvibaculaceae bacterium]
MDSVLSSNVLGALGQPTRFEILKLVAGHSRGPKPKGLQAGEIARRLGLAPTTLSFHLKEMTHKGLLVPIRSGRTIAYRAELALLLAVLEDVVSNICE